MQKHLVEQAGELAANWPELAPARARVLLRALVSRIEIHAEQVDIHLCPSKVSEILRGESVDGAGVQHHADEKSMKLEVPAILKRAGIETRMVVEGTDPYGTTNPDSSLIKLLAKAHALQEKLLHGNGLTLDGVAKQENISGSYFTRLLRLTYLAPDITKAILDGRQPHDLTAAKLMRESRLPLEWSAQRRVLGFARSGPRPITAN